MLLAELARTSAEIAATTGRSEKTALLARLFSHAEPDEAPVVVTYLAGRLPQRRTNLGWRALAEPVAPAARPTLTVSEVDAALTAIAAVAGRGAVAERRRLLHRLLGAATAEEQDFLVRLIGGELRQGALDAMAVEGLASAVGADPREVRRAVMLGGSLGEVARGALAEGPPALAEFRLTVGRPVLPMLAHTAADVAEALDALGPAAVEEKLDGVRAQVHVADGRARVFTRTLDEITERLPEVTRLARGLPVGQAVLDGEVVALDTAGRPLPFQDIAGRVGTRDDVPTAHATLPLTAVFFDLLSVDGRELLEAPAAERHRELARIVEPPHLIRRIEVTDPHDARQREAAAGFAERMVADGREGVVVKSLDSVYRAGRRGRSWLKVKPVHTLDLVVLAAEWGHGRRTGLLSNLHLGARSADGSFVMLGKTFKGLTDALLRWQTERLSRLAVAEEPWGVRVRPELVVEIAFDGVQRSTRYPAGVTLRFARVLRYREDKPAVQADTVEAVLALRR
ncbi:ATP-dependent DNA ligase [Streptomyces alkaliterrae]|uniref:Probable DNA ligase n=1 Tax=Streptomyces alkaliterrae TaxID=2213162 RepID=A0A5P0YSD2_9ACTN|nr:ATP-dependent DNA ligase [Streptomyces alkaliterrae]MBB1258351.1 ATP-dependent DNA ligase [Streptomyces alkaliterrae]MQS02352.1 ATP-dependent DNA ligase [Streptomyces alkaliterrae]